MTIVRTCLNKIKLYLVIFFITIILMEVGAAIALKTNIFKNWNHAFLTFNFTEITNNNFLNLKKNISLKDEISIFTDSNRLRVDNGTFDYNLKNTFDKVLFLGDSVPFGWGVNYEDSIPGSFEKINKKFSVINAAVPSYTINQSVDKFIKEFKNIKNIKYIYLSNYNPIGLYQMFGLKWDESLNWTNYIDYFSDNIFFYKYRSIPIWGEISLFKILRKIYVMNFFKIPKNKIYERNLGTDERFIMNIKNQLDRLSKNIDKDTIVIFTPITSPLHFNDNSSIDEVNKELLNLINKVNNSVKLYNKKNFIYLDVVNIFKDYRTNELFIDACCHLTPFGASEVSKKLNQIIKLQ